jgi:hypothetical protein
MFKIAIEKKPLNFLLFSFSSKQKLSITSITIIYFFQMLMIARKIYSSSNVLCIDNITHINFHIFDWKRFDDWIFCRHVPVELVPAFVPLDAVEGIAAQVVAASQIGLLTLLDELGDSDRQVGQAVDH